MLDTPDTLDKYISQFREDQQQQAGGTNHDIYEKRLTEPDSTKWERYRLTPHSMYFYYVRINSDGRLVIDHYHYFDEDETNDNKWKEIPYTEEGLQDLVTELALNARPLLKDATRIRKPPLIAKGNFNKTQWKHISYVAIFFDEANWSLRKKAPGSGEAAVTFIVDDGVKKGTPNHSFFDAIDLPITMPIRRPRQDGPTEDTRSAIVFVNHMKGDDNGRDLGKDAAGNDLSTKEYQKFEFKMILDVEAEMPDDPPTVVIIDPGGENGGPSVPPPPVIP